MACEVEVMNGSDFKDTGSDLVDDHINEITTLKKSLKEKLLNDAMNGNVNGASSSSDCSVMINNNGNCIENGIEEEKLETDVESDVTLESLKGTPNKKGLRGRPKKVGPGESKKQIIDRKVDVVEEEGTCMTEQSEQIWHGKESVDKDNEDDASTIDVVGDNDEHPNNDDIQFSLEDEISTDISTEKFEEETAISTIASNVNLESYRRSSRRTSKEKQVKLVKKAVVKSKKQQAVKKVKEDVEQDSSRSEPSGSSQNVAESASIEDYEDETNIIDAGSNEYPSAVGDKATTENEAKIEVGDEKASEEGEENSTMFSRLRRSIRFSVSPRKKAEVTSCSGSGRSQFSISNEHGQFSFRGISGRRPLRQSHFSYETCETESSRPYNLKRKAQSESPGSPQRKYFITSFSERSPGWKFFSSPFSRFWSSSQKTTESTILSSTPLRNLHEDVEIEGSMAVNVGESIDISTRDGFDLEKENEKEKNIEKIGIGDDSNSTANRWCIVM